ncbi:MAG: Rrf2 family transcriptional regulator [Acidobacteria bacterium]|nr:Rrf2 family transcriptional regulator [Acidobacteriota bacterium]
MLRLSKKADYALIAVRHLAMHYGEGTASARDIAQAYAIPPPLMAKVLQRLARGGLLVSQQGSTGGYALARPPAFISALQVINAIDGPLMITSCVTSHGECMQTPRCTVREPLRKVNESIVNALGSLSMAVMASGLELRG